MNYPYQMPTQQYNPYQINNNPYLQMNQPQIQGKVVNGFNEITANDVPMTGSNAYFPKADNTEISVRRWNNNGTISESLYRLVEPTVATQVEETTNADYSDEFKAISDRLDRIEKLIAPTKRGKSNESTNNSKSDVE